MSEIVECAAFCNRTIDLKSNEWVGSGWTVVGDRNIYGRWVRRYYCHEHKELRQP